MKAYRDALVLRAAARYAETNPIIFPSLPEDTNQDRPRSRHETAAVLPAAVRSLTFAAGGSALPSRCPSTHRAIL
jgi:hypothetical protein